MKKILLVEDEKILAEMYKDKLLQAGFQVSLSFDSKNALESVKKEKPDLIVLDILLPRENGIVFLDWLKEYPEASNLPIIVFSNYDDPVTKKRALEMGVKDYLIKTSLTPQQLLEKIKSYFE